MIFIFSLSFFHTYAHVHIFLAEDLEHPRESTLQERFGHQVIIHVTKEAKKKDTEEDIQAQVFLNNCSHWTQNLIFAATSQHKELECLNYGVWFELLEKFNNERKQRCNIYEAEVSTHRTRKKLYDLRKQLSSHDSQPLPLPPLKCDKLSITWKPFNVNEKSLDCIHGLWNEISKQFHLHSLLVLHDIELERLCVTWHILADEGIKELIAEHIPSSESFLRENNITSIICSDECLYCQVSLTSLFCLSLIL